MNSCLYECEVMHERLSPRKHKFNYRVFMFYLDLDEIDSLHKKLKLFSRNRFNWFSFRDRDHLQWPASGIRDQRTNRENIESYLRDQGIDQKVNRIMLLTNVATLGYSFNPISFYLCFSENDQPICSVAEVCNTHSEMKLYMLNSDSLAEGTFRKMVSKYFYVSPFADLDSTFDFIFKIPGNTMHMRVDDYQNGKRFLLSSLSGKKKDFTDANLFWYGIRFPLIPLQVITSIYWQAFVLRLKRVPFNRKNFNLHLQKETYHYK
ncbi:MAG: DUF1365 domain-containing protein [Bacteroidetes bacterium]|nr:DUF1365 domain-containing protein [Bacteroidota bacterium]